MAPDNDGFLYPQVDEHLCINCGLCEKACPIIQTDSYQRTQEPDIYAAYSKNEKVRLNSSSGGIFYHIAGSIINTGGAVFGAAFDENFKVIHRSIEKIEDLTLFQGSKYVQSEIGNTYYEAKKMLDNGRVVLFSGTPCQIRGLYGYLGREYDNLYTQDLICHGAPSPKVWKLYLEHRENKAASKTRRTFFRHKKYGWKKYSVLFEYSNNTEYLCPVSKDAYMRGFLADLYLRQSCADCKAKGVVRESDITLADFWSIEAVYPDMFDDKGVSLVLIHSEKGKRLFEEIDDYIVKRQTDKSTAIKYNHSIIDSVTPHKNRNKFFATVTANNFEKMIDIALKKSFIDKLKTKTKNALIKIKRLAK